MLDGDLRRRHDGGDAVACAGGGVVLPPNGPRLVHTLAVLRRQLHVAVRHQTGRQHRAVRHVICLKRRVDPHKLPPRVGHIQPGSLTGTGRGAVLRLNGPRTRELGTGFKHVTVHLHWGVRERLEKEKEGGREEDLVSWSKARDGSALVGLAVGAAVPAGHGPSIVVREDGLQDGQAEAAAFVLHSQKVIQKPSYLGRRRGDGV